MIENLLKQTILDYAHNLKSANGGWLKCNCPMCPSMGQTRDTRARFGIVFSNDGSFGMNCFNCGFNARFNVGSTISQKLVSYLQTIGVPDQDIRELKFTAYREKMDIISDREPEFSENRHGTTSWHRSKKVPGDQQSM